jgi:hypothetical protein
LTAALAVLQGSALPRPLRQAGSCRLISVKRLTSSSLSWEIFRRRLLLWL